MLGALGMVFMVIGGLLLLSATRAYSLHLANRRRARTRAPGESWLKLLLVMAVTGVALIAAGYLLAR